MLNSQVKIKPSLALLRGYGWELVLWWRRHNPDADFPYSPGPFLGPEAEIASSREAGYTVTVLPRPDGCDRPSIHAPGVYAVAARWPRLVACIASGNALTVDEAAWGLWTYLKGDRGKMFGKTFPEMVSQAVRQYFGRMPDGERYKDSRLVDFWRKDAIVHRPLVAQFIAQNRNQK